MINDFDQWKNYEESMLKILDFYQSLPQKNPLNHDILPLKFKKDEGDTR